MSLEKELQTEYFKRIEKQVQDTDESIRFIERFKENLYNIKQASMSSMYEDAYTNTFNEIYGQIEEQQLDLFNVINYDDIIERRR